MLALIRTLTGDETLAEQRYAEAMRVQHYALTAVVSWIAFCMLWPDNNLFGSARTFRVFADLLPQQYWGIGFSIAAAFGFAGIIWQRNQTVDAIATAVVSCAHMVVGMTLAASFQVTFGTVSYAAWGALGFHRLYVKLIRAQ